jgi:hypothetical protein
MGTIQQANAAADAQRYNAKVAEMNATLSDRRAKDAVARGAQEEQRKRMQVAQLKGSQRAAMAANGVDLSFGSPLDTLVDTAVLGELDALNIRSNSYRESYDHQVDAVNQRAGATLANHNAASAQTGGYLDAFGTILTGGGKAYRDYRTPTIGAIA